MKRNCSLALCGLVLLISGCESETQQTTKTASLGSTGSPEPVATIPFKPGSVSKTYYDGSGDGLVAGLGLSGLRTAPAFYADAANPQIAEIRRQAIYNNYTALVDQSANGGFGTLYGPKDDSTFAGTEYLAFVGEGINRATLMVQVPDSFDRNNPCIVAAPSSGSRGVYGAIGTAGVWGLEHNCAVAYTDANKGTGAVELTQQKGFGKQLQLLDLTEQGLSFQVPTADRVSADDSEYAGVVPPTATELNDFIVTRPDRFAFKHAHSQKNIEKDWGLHTLQGIKLALQLLNQDFAAADPYRADNTLIIAASVSNGGSAALRAAEQDVEGLIDAVVVGEPNINPAPLPTTVTVKMGTRNPVTEIGKPAYAYFVQAELYAACASLAPDNSGALFAALRGPVEPRCDALVAAGLLSDGSYAQEGAEAAAKLRQAGFLKESDKLLVGYAGIDLFQSLLATYGNAYSRSSVVDNLCNISFGHVAAGTTTVSPHTALKTLAASSSGIPRTASVYPVKDDAQGGPMVQIAATSANGTQDYNLEGALCWRDLWQNSANPLNARLVQGISEVQGSGNLRGLPVIMIHGRADALIPVNHASRPYYALNKLVEGSASKLHYYEVTHAQHLDTLNPLYASTGLLYVPMDYYFKQGMDLMLDHLRKGTELPASQVVHTTPPAAGVAISASDMPPISPSATALIRFDGEVLTIPDQP